MMRSRFQLILGAFFLVILAGCDSVDPSSETIFLTMQITEDVDGNPISLGFNANDLQTGRLQDLDCGCQLDIAGKLSEQGFSKGEIVSASLQSAQIVMLFPVNENVAFLDQAILKFTATGVSQTEVANTSNFPASRTAQMTVLPNRDIAAFLERPNFGLILQIDPETLRTGQSYEMSLVLTVRVEVEGV
ncbi:MAG: hypothetical protein RIE53_12775 [Rhodothermales bacterium]